MTPAPVKLPSPPASNGAPSFAELLQRLDEHPIPTPEVSLSRLLARIERRRRVGTGTFSN
jgi:hypothetical protein